MIKKLFLMVMSMAAVIAANAQDRMYISDFTIAAGATMEVSINLDNTTVFTAFQADIYLPDGLSIEQEDGDYLFELTSRKGRNHTVSSQLLSNGAVRVLVASQTLKEISGNSGAIVTFPIIAATDFEGQKTISLKNVVASTTDRVEHELADTNCTVTEASYNPGGDPQPRDGDVLYINDFTIAAGSTQTIEIQLDNETVFTALQADIYLPGGLSIEQDDGEYIFDLTSRKGRNHTVSSQLLSNGAIRILIASQTLKEISGNSGAIVTFPIIAAANFEGQKTISLKNVVASTTDRVEHELADTDCTVTEASYTPPQEQTVTGLAITSLTLPKGITVNFNVTAIPATAATPTVAWSTSDSTIATAAADGTISLLKEGVVTITATTTDGSNVASQYMVNVTAAQYTPGDINNDRVIDGSDVSALLEIVLSGE